jgi:hypothetical protein
MSAKKAGSSSGLPLCDALASMDRPRLTDYCAAAAEYIRTASTSTASQQKIAQVQLSNSLAAITLADIRERLGLPMPLAVARERQVGGGLRSVQADVSEMTPTDGLTLAIEIKPVHLAIGRAIWNRFGDIRTFAVNIHLKFPFAVIGGIMTLPTEERLKSGDDERWKSTAGLIARAADRFSRAGSRRTEAEAAHLLEGIAVVAFDHQTGAIDPAIPPAGKGLRWDEFIEAIATAYEARFGDVT